MVSVPSAGLPGPVLLLAACFLGWATSFASVLLFSSLCGFLLLCQFLFLGIFPCLDLLAFFATVSSLAILGSCRSLLPRYFSSSRVPLCDLASPPVALWPSVFLWLSSLLFLDRPFLSPVSGFLLLVLGFSVVIPQSFLSCAFAFLSSSRMLLLGWGFGCPVLPSFMYF